MKSTCADYLLLFVSLDLVNSTAFKASDERGRILDKGSTEGSKLPFSSIFSDFFQYFHAFAEKSGGQHWKMNGDEYLFYYEVGSRQQVCQHLEKVWREMFEYDLVRLPGKLGIKGAAWLVRLHDVEEQDHHWNYRVSVAVAESGQGGGRSAYNSKLDFFGRSFDEGFRVAKNATRGTIAVSAEVAWCVPTSCILEGMEPLKGIWRGEPYPIFQFVNTAYIQEELGDNHPRKLQVPDKNSKWFKFPLALRYRLIHFFQILSRKRAGDAPPPVFSPKSHHLLAGAFLPPLLDYEQIEEILNSQNYFTELKDGREVEADSACAFLKKEMKRNR